MSVKLTFDINENVVKGLFSQQEKSLRRAGILFANKLKVAVAKDTSDHARSIESKAVSESRVEVGSGRPQAHIEEFGRKPGKFPNLNALVGWAARHGFHSAGKTTPYDALPSDAKGSVFVLARSIAKKGIKAKQTYTKTYEDNIEAILDFYQKDFNRGTM